MWPACIVLWRETRRSVTFSLIHRFFSAHIQAYVRRIEELVGVPVRWIGVGPGRLDVIDRGEDCTLRIDSLNRREFAN